MKFNSKKLIYRKTTNTTAEPVNIKYFYGPLHNLLETICKGLETYEYKTNLIKTIVAL